MQVIDVGVEDGAVSDCVLAKIVRVQDVMYQIRRTRSSDWNSLNDF
jgi:hypothetical protein